MLPCSQDIHILEGCHKDIMIQFQSLTINRLIIVRYIGWWYYYCYILWDESLNSKHSITAPASQLSQPARQNWNWDKIGNSAKLKDFLYFLLPINFNLHLEEISESLKCSIGDCVICHLFYVSNFNLYWPVHCSAVLAMFPPLSAEVWLKIVLFWSSLQSYNDNPAQGYWQGSLVLVRKSLQSSD